MSNTNASGQSSLRDGVHALPPREQMREEARKIRDTYAMIPGAPFLRREFGFFTQEPWKSEGLADNADWNEVFMFDPWAKCGLGQLGWCEAAFSPCYDTKVIEDRGDHEVEQDYAGRHVLYFKGRRSGFMPEYIDHPVKDWKTWEENVKWRLNPSTPGRYADLDARMASAKEQAAHGLLMEQGLIGGYMYLRSLIGPTDLLYMFCEAPDLLHDCMKVWFELADTVIARHQQQVTIDELFFAEDICYNHGSLISPDMMREFLLPYYQQLIMNLRSRQIDKTRKLYIHVDTDGLANPIIPIYKEIDMNVMSPFEVASGCDVVTIGRQYPDLVMLGGIDKRILATSKKEIDRHLEHILPAMRARGGYIPTCDHGVPEEVSLENYLHYRQRCVELGG